MTPKALHTIAARLRELARILDEGSTVDGFDLRVIARQVEEQANQAAAE
jgi:hypothetical protein